MASAGGALLEGPPGEQKRKDWLKCCLGSAMHRVLSLARRHVALMPNDSLSYLLASLLFINLTEIGHMRCLPKLCAATVPE